MSYGRPQNGYFISITSTNDWQELDFGFDSGYQMFIGGAANDVDFSYSEAGDLSRGGPKPIHGVLLAGEQLRFDHRITEKVYIRSTVLGSHDTIRVYSW